MQPEQMQITEETHNDAAVVAPDEEDEQEEMVLLQDEDDQGFPGEFQTNGVDKTDDVKFEEETLLEDLEEDKSGDENDDDDDDIDDQEHEQIVEGEQGQGQAVEGLPQRQKPQRYGGKEKEDDKGQVQQRSYQWPRDRFTIVSEVMELLAKNGGEISGKELCLFLRDKRIPNLKKKRMKKVIAASDGELIWERQHDVVCSKQVHGRKYKANTKSGGNNNPSSSKAAASKRGKQMDDDFNWYAVNQILMGFLKQEDGVKTVGEVLEYLYRHIRNPGKVDLYNFLKKNPNVEVSTHYVNIRDRSKYSMNQKRKPDHFREDRSRRQRRRQDTSDRYNFREDDYGHQRQQQQHPYRSSQAQHVGQQTMLLQGGQLALQPVGTPQGLQNIQALGQQGMGIQTAGAQLQEQLGGQASLVLRPQLTPNLGLLDQGTGVNLLSPALNVVPNAGQGQVIKLPNGDMYLVQTSAERQ
eukprot:TRINITY_DN5602_c1_g1_i1.p1 TRINITY_DN5602_c1_g1~~TRINITY_DN5602_c1_g1_i1.p1  ORF type:complete len:467 (+),score=78.07 TRINITY_DN5602_c1_g1_i1:120-1520(+)